MAVPTNKQLAVELKVGVAFGWGLQEAQGQLVHLQQRLLHIPLRSYVMPLLVVQRHVRLYRQNHWAIAHIKREGHNRRRCGNQFGARRKNTNHNNLLATDCFIFILFNMQHRPGTGSMSWADGLNFHIYIEVITSFTCRQCILQTLGGKNSPNTYGKIYKKRRRQAI